MQTNVRFTILSISTWNREFEVENLMSILSEIMVFTKKTHSYSKWNSCLNTSQLSLYNDLLSGLQTKQIQGKTNLNMLFSEDLNDEKSDF